MRKLKQEKNRLSSTPRGGPRSVGRVFAILDALSQTGNSTSLSELAASTGAPKTSLVGLLTGLTDEGCLLRDEAGRYSLGPRFLSLAMRATAGRELVVLARPVLDRLAAASDETAILGSLAPDADLVIYLDKVESANPIRYAVTVGERRELYCTAMGKILLAYFEPKRLARYLRSTPLKQFTKTTLSRATELKADLQAVRENGVVCTNNERIKGASGIASPILAGDGGVVAALTVAGPSERIHANRQKIEPLVIQAAAECTQLAGGDPGSLAHEY